MPPVAYPCSQHTCTHTACVSLPACAASQPECGHPRTATTMDEASEERSQEKVAAEADGDDAKEAPVPERVRGACVCARGGSCCR